MQWDDIFTDSRYTELPPAGEVLDFLELLPQAPGREVLDHGCGAGRHTLLLAQHGYAVSGVDISPRGCELTRRRLEQAGLEARVTIGDMRKLPYERRLFDAVVSRGVITHGTCPEVATAVAEIARVLRPDGLFLCTFISTRSSLFGRGERIDDRTWICDDELESGVVHHFMRRQDVRAMTRRSFEEIAITHLEHGGVIDNGRPYVSAHWVFTGRRL
jgi:cyclopropane fatty-acyl-phospholipid synthase-like methyltransferase